MPNKIITLDNLSTFKGHVEEKAVVLTAAQYDALTPEQKNADITYYITDGVPVPMLNNLIFSIKQVLEQGETSLTFTDSRLSGDSIIQIFYPNSNTDIDYKTFEQLSSTSFRLTFDEQENDVTVAALIFNV